MALFFLPFENYKYCNIFIYLSIRKFNHGVFALLNESAACVSFKKCASITFQRWANVDPTLPHKLKAWGKYASKYICWANGGLMLIMHKTYFSLEFVKFV